MKITLPDNYSEVTVGQYMDLWSMYEKEDDPYLAQRKCIELLAGIEEGTLKNATWESIEEASAKLNWLISEPDPFELKLPLIRRFELNGKQYGFIPDMTKLTVGEYADLETYCKGGMFNVLEKLCAILFREVKVEEGDRYEIALYSPDEESKKTMLELPMNIAVAAVVFFLQYRRGISFRFGTLFQSAAGEEGGDAIHKKWGWFGLIYQMASGNILQMRDVHDIYIEEALTFMAYEKDLNLADKIKM